MAFIDGTVVNVALPALQSGMNATVIDVQWVIEAYSLLLSALLLIGGALGDYYGRRRVFLIGVGIFAAASVACGCAANIRQLIAARGLQGVGAALLVPGSLAIISSSFRPEERGRAIGIWSGTTAITTALGPLLGGWLIEHISWRAAFFINLPIALVVVFLALGCVAESSDTNTGQLDWWGSLLASLGLGALVYGLVESSRLGFANPLIITILLAAIVVIVIFLLFEARAPNPILPLPLFRSRTFAGTNLLTFLLYAALGGALFFLPLNLIQVQHYSAAEAGAAMLPFILVISLLSRWSGSIVAKHGAKLPLMIGPSIAALGYLLLAWSDVGGIYWKTFFLPIVILGFGMAISVAPLTTTVMGSVSQNRVGVASGVNNAVARTAGLIAIAVLGIVMLHLFDRELGRQLAGSKLPEAMSESLLAQHIKLAAIPLPQNESWQTQQLIRHAIQESFIFGFRAVSVICALLAALAATSAWTLLGATSSSAVLKSRQAAVE
jgi:EmrB/QacA subfamily drug resistance transporter